MSQGKFRCLRYKPVLLAALSLRRIYIYPIFTNVSHFLLYEKASPRKPAPRDNCSLSICHEFRHNFYKRQSKAISHERSETAEARERRLARVTARRRERLASETAEERKTRLSRANGYVGRPARESVWPLKQLRSDRERLRQAARRRELHVLHAMLSFHMSVQSITLFIVLLKFN